MKSIQIHFFLLIFLLLGSCSPEAEPPDIPVFEEKVCEGDLLLSTTKDVSARHFCTEFLASLHIESQSQLDNISLAGLKSLTKIHGDLLIYHGNITSLEGLENLRHVGGDIRIYTERLKSLRGLENLSYVGGGIKIFRGGLEEISLPALNHVGGTIEISNNDKLTSVTNFHSLAEAKNILVLENPLLHEISGFNALETMQSLKIEENNELILISGFAAVHQLDYFTVAQNPKLRSVPGFKKLKTVLNNLHFYGNTVLSDISSLNALEVVHGTLNLTSNRLDLENSFESLKEVGGNLVIIDNQDTGPMNSFNNLLKVKGKNLDLLSNEAETMGGFAKLEEANNVRVGWNKAGLIDGFEVLAGTGGILQIQFNPNLVRLTAFPGLTSTGGVELRSNDKLTDVIVFNTIETVSGELKITENANLLEIIVGEQLTTVQGDIQILNNQSLEMISGLDGLNSKGRIISIQQNARLLSIEGFNAVTVTDYLQISDNNQLKTVSGFQSLKKADYNVSIGGNPQLTNLFGLKSLEEVGSIFTIAGNKLSDLRAFSNLKTVGEVLEVRNEPVLVSLDGLENLTSELEFIRISNNPELTDISAIANLGGVRDYVHIQANEKLSVCNNSFICNFVKSGGTVSFAYNAPGCENVEAVKTSCN